MPKMRQEPAEKEEGKEQSVQSKDKIPCFFYVPVIRFKYFTVKY
jgi:hypothetical protein